MWIVLLCNTLTVPAWPVAAAAWRDLCSYFIRNIICCAPGSQQAAWSGATARVQDTTVATRASNEGSRRLRVLQSRRRFVWSSTQQPHWRFSFYALYKEVLISCLGQPYCQFRKCRKKFFHASVLYCASGNWWHSLRMQKRLWMALPALGTSSTCKGCVTAPLSRVNPLSSIL